MASREHVAEELSPDTSKRPSSLEDAWSERRDEDVGTVEDYTSIIFNLHVWSYRLSQQEFTKYEQRAQLKQAARVFDHKHLSMLFRDGSFTQRLTSGRGRQQREEQLIDDGMQASGFTQAQQGTAETALRQQQRSFLDEPLLPRSVTGRSSHRIPSRREIKVWKYTFFWKRAQSGLRVAKVGKSTARSWFGLPMLPVNHPLMVAWSVLVLLIDLTYTAVMLPLMFAFDLLHPWQGQYWVSVTVGCLYCLDVFVVLHRGVVVRYLDRHIYIDSPSDVARLYVTHGSFWRDLPVALSGPLQLLALIPGDQLHPNNVAVIVNTFLLLRSLRLMKLLLLSRELFFGKMGFRHMNYSMYRWYTVSLVYVLAVLINWLACIMLLVARVEDTEHSWLANVKGEDLTTAPGRDQYMAAFYWMLISTLTIGYGDISASTPVEQAAVVAAVITGVLFIGYAIKSLMDILVEAALQDEYAQRISTLRTQAGALKVWASWQDLPNTLVDPVFRYFMGPWLTNQVVCKHWGNVLEDLPAQLRGQVLEHLLVVKHKELSPLGMRLLASIPRVSSWHVLALLHPVPLAPGQQLCWEGEEAKYIWLMQEGSLVSLNGVVPDLSTIIDMPGMIIAFDALAWIQQQQQRQRQRDQDGSSSSSSSRERQHRHSSRHQHQKHRQSRSAHHGQQTQQQQLEAGLTADPPKPPGSAPAAAAAAAAAAEETPWATPLASRAVSASPISAVFSSQQAQQQQQQEEQASRRGSAFGAIVREISSNSRQPSRDPGGQLQQQAPPSTTAAAAAAADRGPPQEQQQQQGEATAAAAAAAPSVDSSRAPSSRISDSADLQGVTSGPGTSRSDTRGPADRPGVTSGPRTSRSDTRGPRSGVTSSPGVLKYTCSYQAVSTSFFWALPLHQLGLAFEGLPQLLGNFHAELTAHSTR